MPKVAEKPVSKIETRPLELRPFTSSLESSHIMLHEKLLNQEWFIRNEEIEEVLKASQIKWWLEVKPNSFSQYGRVVHWDVSTPHGQISSLLELMIKNCGAAVWGGIDYLNDKTFPISEFIARNVASYTGTGVIIATGTEASGKRLEKAGWTVPVYRPSSRGPISKVMGYGILNIPEKDMFKKRGFNHDYSSVS